MEKEKNKKPKKIIAFFLGLILLGVGAFAGVYYGLNRDNSDNAQEVVVEEAYFDLGEIFVNLSDNDGKRYVKLTATVSYNSKNKDLAEEVVVKKVALRDAAIFYFKSRKSDDFKSENELLLKKNLIEALNHTLATGVLLDVKFNELLIQ